MSVLKMPKKPDCLHAQKGLDEFMPVAICFIVLLILTACAPDPLQTPSAQSLPATSMLATLEPTLTTAVLPTQTTAVLETPPITTLVIWLPEPLAPIDNEDSADILSEQISGFLAANPDIRIELRLKRASDVGGILSTLRSANAVARDALPDITLLRRTDLTTAVDAGYITEFLTDQPLALADDLTPTILTLGTVGEALYGLPYALELWHTAYDPSSVEIELLTIDNLRASQAVFWLPINSSSGINETLYAQIIAAGGVFETDGGLTIDEDMLAQVFAFYADGIAQGVIPPDTLMATDATAYQDRLLTGEAMVGVVSTHLYRQLVAQNDALLPASLPTLAGEPITVLDGWMWVKVTTPHVERQRAAEKFMAWMFDPERQTAYTSAVSYLPSRQAARGLWDDQAYAAFIETQLENVVYPLTGEAAVTGRIIQTSLLDVMNGTRTADEAARDVITQIGG